MELIQEDLEQDYFVWEELDWLEGGKWVDEYDLQHLTEQPVKEKIRRKISERD